MVLQYTVNRSGKYIQYEDREDHDVDIFTIIQEVQDTVIHLKVDEEQMADHTRK